MLSEQQITQLLVQRAGLTPADVEMGKPDFQFESILRGLVDIHRGKEVLYGNYMETHGSEPENFCLVQHFCDTKRKYVRAENFVKLKSDGKDLDLMQLLDTYSDLAVYAAMGIQLTLHLIERKKNEIL